MALDRPRTERFERGLQIRREVLGEAHVERSLEAATDFSWPSQTLATEWAWAEIWGRPGLDRRSRSLLNLGMLAALNRPLEFKVHVRGAINNGVTVAELQEVILQIGGYCGIPAAMDCFRLASEVLKEMGKI